MKRGLVTLLMGVILLFATLGYVWAGGSSGCTDTDNDLNILIRGVTRVTSSGLEYADQCVNKQILEEYYCNSSGGMSVSIANCSTHVTNKFCQNGKCVETFVQQTDYSDSDGGKDYYVQGVLKDVGGHEYADFCINYTYLSEFYTANGPLGLMAAEEKKWCATGCAGGACSSSGTCASLGGNLCNSNQMCVGTTITESTDGLCCNAPCTTKRPYCAEIYGYLCDSSIQVCPGNLSDSQDTTLLVKCCSAPCNNRTIEVACTPNCTNKNCGSDGCSGSCGTCSGTCTDGICNTESSSGGDESTTSTNSGSANSGISLPSSNCASRWNCTPSVYALDSCVKGDNFTIICTDLNKCQPVKIEKIPCTGEEEESNSPYWWWLLILIPVLLILIFLWLRSRKKDEEKKMPQGKKGTGNKGKKNQ